ncbi:hypothetical protein [uncultured Paraglaciecola sp.]|uniref:hypothetical protein n=1 Tax=uncultured Paraglaciecola sp. TaxID=1765024 RepID=UPI00261556ED|nr:hypothetical protein [uncultured Paraglaciecola sp.]
MSEKFVSNTQLRTLLSEATEDEKLAITKLLDTSATTALGAIPLQKKICFEGGHGLVNFFRNQGTGYIDILDDVADTLDLKGLPSYHSKLKYFDNYEQIDGENPRYTEVEAIRLGLDYCEQAEVKIIQELIKRSYEHLLKQRDKAEGQCSDTKRKINSLVIKERRLVDESVCLLREIFSYSKEQLDKSLELILPLLAKHQHDWIWPNYELMFENPAVTCDWKKEMVDKLKAMEEVTRKFLLTIKACEDFPLISEDSISIEQISEHLIQHILETEDEDGQKQIYINKQIEKFEQYSIQYKKLIKEKNDCSNNILSAMNLRDSLINDIAALNNQIKDFDNKINEVVTKLGDASHAGLAGTTGLVVIANLGGFATYTLLTSFMSVVSFGTLGFGAYTAATSLLSIAIGPVGWVALGGYAMFSFGKPSMSKLVPIVATIGAIRQRIKYET